MTITNGYITRAELKNQLGVADAMDDNRLDYIATATSRGVDEWCGQFFYDAGSASARVFRARRQTVLDTHPYNTTTGLVVATDEGDNGTYGLTWTVTTDYVPDPPDGRNVAGRTVAYSGVLAVGSKVFPIGGRRARVQVTARWGWTAVPDEVREATLIKAARLAKRKDQLGDEAGGFGAIGLFRVGTREDPDVVALLAAFRRPVVMV